MGTVGTFDAFTTARLGIYAAYKGLSVTGNNISNINTPGYTRQVLDQVSLKTGANDTYRSQYDNHIGNGTLVTGISQIRDPYLDIRYRNTSADVGYYDETLSGLQQIAQILDEVGKGDNEDGMLYAQLQDLADSLRAISADPCKDNDTLARTSADALVGLFNKYADRLESLRLDFEDSLNQDVKTVNGILANIRSLNESIRESDVHGDPALEMRDERNRQIDELSQYLHIKVTYTMEEIGGGLEIERCTIALANDNPNPSVKSDSSLLVDSIYGAQIAVNNDDNYTVTIGKLYDAGGEEWTRSTTTWETVNSGDPGERAKYTYKVSSKNWEAGDKIYIGGKPYEIPGDISVAHANNAEKMADFIAMKLDGSDQYRDTYTVCASGNTIIFTAKEVGNKTGNEPNLNVKSDPDDDRLNIGDRETVRGGSDRVEPDGEPGYPSSTTWDANGSETKISFIEGEKVWMKCTVVTDHTYDVTLDDNDLHGSLQATRELLTESGEFASKAYIDGVDESAAIKRGIPYYQKSFDLLARQFAEQYNKLNQGFMVNEKGNYIAKDGSELKLGGESISKANGLSSEQKAALKADADYDNKYANYFDKNDDFDVTAYLNDLAKDDTLGDSKSPKVPEGVGVLFSNRGDNNDPSGITAANISISEGWSSGSVKIVPTMVELFGKDPKYAYDADGNVKVDENGEPLPNTTQNENVNHMISMINQSLIYDPRALDPAANGTKLFQGSFNDMFSNMNIVLGNDERKTNIKLNSQYTSLVEIDSNREGVSGVDLNDEAMNMMQYQKAYSAACRLMTAIDEVLERLINNTGIAGR